MLQLHIHKIRAGDLQKLDGRQDMRRAAGNAAWMPHDDQHTHTHTFTDVAAMLAHLVLWSHRGVTTHTSSHSKQLTTASFHADETKGDGFNKL
jgi:hypothetical protein